MPLLPSALPPKGEARRYVANDFLNLIALPIGAGGPRQRRSGTLINDVLETLLPALFPAAGALSAPSGYLPLEGKADDTEIQFFRDPHCTSFSHDQKGDAH